RYRISETFAMTGFIDNGNVFLSKDQMQKFSEAYAQDPVQSADERCPSSVLVNRAQENYSYEYRSLLSKPGYIWSRHYFSYGLALNWLTPLGSMNLAYGLPWREPRDSDCDQDPEKCTPRAKQSGFWLTRGEFHINVGARF
ncbi:hypothetical protein E3A20_25120, partial [Planctomyces bekefii]